VNKDEYIYKIKYSMHDPVFGQLPSTLRHWS